MSTKRRGAAAPISPEVKPRNQKRRKVSDDDLADPEEANRESSEAVDEDEADGSDASQDEESGSEVEFEGDNIQTAQDKILSELFRLKDEDGEEVAYPFVGKPDRNLYRDYYEVIQHPVSLRSIQKKVRGTDGRKKGTKMTAFPTWQSFEEEVSYLWRNAREYNEDGSEISVLAGVVENYFKQRVAEAKRLVSDDAIQTSIATDDKPPPGITVNNDTLIQQQELTRTGSASQEAELPQASPQTRSLRRQFESPKSSTGSTQAPTERSYGVTSMRDMSSVTKSETPTTSSHRIDLRTSSYGQNGASVDAVNGSFQDVPTHPPSEKSPMDSLWRRAGQDVASALLRNTQIRTHNSLSLKQGYCLDIPPSSILSQQTVTISLPPSHHLLTVRPTLASSTAQRQVKIIALMGMQRLHSTGDASTLSYDIQLHPGITRVDLEAIAGPARGAPKSGPPGSEVDYERVTMFFHLLR